MVSMEQVLLLGIALLVSCIVLFPNYVRRLFGMTILTTDTSRQHSRNDKTSTSSRQRQQQPQKRQYEPGDMIGKYILLLDVDENLFQACFGKKNEEWSCDIKTFDSSHGSAATAKKVLEQYLNDPNLLCIVIQGMEEDMPHLWPMLLDYYKSNKINKNSNGAFVVYFGIYGEFNAPTELSRAFGVQWRFSAYTSEEYVVTSVGKQYLGDAITKLSYAKSNMIDAPEQDRIVACKAPKTIEEYLEQIEGYSNPKEDADEEEWEDAKQAFPRYADQMNRKAPLVLHEEPNGGKICYLGFINGDGDIPNIVRALLTNQHLPNQSNQTSQTNQTNQPVNK